MKRTALRIALTRCLALLCATGGTLSASSAEAPAETAGCDMPAAMHADGARASLVPGSLEAVSLARHNAERARLGLPPLSWSCRLEAEAARWAGELAARDQLEHASAARREGSGENLWMGTTGRFQPQEMVGRFVEEGRLYLPGRFPDVSRTGNWADVGHYTQLVWRDTRELGCALAKGERNDVLVCRYFPAGNVIGRTAF